jgi:hypothetical protein
MARNRKGLRPLSQTGLPRIPQNPKQRVPMEGGGKQPGSVLDAFNERQETRQLHPTKGWRNLSVKRSRAQAVIAAVHNGQQITTAGMAMFLRTGKTNEGLL